MLGKVTQNKDIKVMKTIKISVEVVYYIFVIRIKTMKKAEKRRGREERVDKRGRVW